MDTQTEAVEEPNGHTARVRSGAQSSLTLCAPRTVACQAPVSVRICRQQYWRGLPLPIPGELPDPGSKLASPALAGKHFTTRVTWNPCSHSDIDKMNFKTKHVTKDKKTILTIIKIHYSCKPKYTKCMKQNSQH